MEDLIISPWQSQENKQKPELYNLFSKTQSSSQENTLTNDKHLKTEQNDYRNSLKQNKKFKIQIFRKKGQSLSSSQNTQERKICQTPKKLQIKLVSYPKIQKQKQKLIKARYSQNIQISARKKPHYNSFEAIQTIFSISKKDMKIFKERSSNKHQTFHEQVEKMMKTKKHDHFKTESIPKINVTKKEIKQNQYLGHQNHLKTFNMALDPIKFQSKSESKKSLDMNNHLKSIQRLKLRKQKLQDIFILEEQSKPVKTLKKKNKIFLNQLEKYNLFGIKKLKKKQQINQ